VGRGRCRLCKDDTAHGIIHGAGNDCGRMSKGFGDVIIALVGGCSLDLMESGGRST
jgi:hypothetical protein